MCKHFLMSKDTKACSAEGCGLHILKLQSVAKHLGHKLHHLCRDNLLWESSCPGKWRSVFSEHHLCRDAAGTAGCIMLLRMTSLFKALHRQQCPCISLPWASLGLMATLGLRVAGSCFRHSLPWLATDVHLGKHTKQETNIIYGQTGKIIFSTAVWRIPYIAGFHDTTERKNKSSWK